MGVIEIKKTSEGASKGCVPLSKMKANGICSYDATKK